MDEFYEFTQKWPNYRIIKYIIINNCLNRDEKSKAKGVTVKALITSPKMMKALEGGILHHPKESDNETVFIL